jgi:DNA-binding beta-propeller fold protein YncE
VLRRLALAGALALALLTTGPGTATTSAAAGAPCTPWQKTRVAAGLGSLENLSFDGTGGLLLSSSAARGSILRLAPDGSRSTLVSGVKSPGGQVVVGRTLYFTTGNGFADGFLGLLGVAGGTISALDLDTGSVQVVADRLVMPNGLIRLPDGSFLVSRDLGAPGRTTRVLPDGTRSTFAPSVTSTNGMAYDATTGTVYIASTFNPTTTISAVDLAHPDAAPRVIRLPGPGPLNAADDLVLGADGFLYVALNVAGRVVRVDPATGAACTIARGLPLSSSLRFGAGPGWDDQALYVTSFRGTVTRLAP